MSMLLAAALAAATGALPAHKANVEHRGQNLAVEYHPAVEMKLRQAGMAPPGRPNTQICNWTASVIVERKLDGASVTRRVGDTHEISGSQAGNCNQQRDLIMQQVANRSGDVQAHVAAVAAADRPVLVAELDHAHGRTAY